MQFRNQQIHATVWNNSPVVSVTANFEEKTVNERVHLNTTPNVDSSIEEQDDLSEFEKSVAELFSQELVNLDYIQDLFQQEQVFKDNFEQIQKDLAGKYIVVCGGEIFDGETLKEAETRAREKYNDRPTYSYSPTVEL